MATDRDLMSQAVAAAIRNGQLTPADAGAVALAVRYAELLDDAAGTEDAVRLTSDLGPKLLAVLTSLGLTMAGRGLKGGTSDAGSRTSPLDELRARRAARANRA